MNGINSRLLFREASLLMVALISLFLLTHSGYDASEAGYHYAVAQQFVRHGEISFDKPMEGIFTVAPNGRTYASHEFGNILFLIPVSAVNRLVEAQLSPLVGANRTEMITNFLFASMGTLLCAAGATFLYLTLRIVFEQSSRSATVSALLFCFCSFYWTYSRMIFDGVLCSVLLSASMLFLFLYARDLKNDRLLVIAMALLGYALITRLSMALGIVAAGVYLLAVIGLKPKRLLRAAAISFATLVPFVCWQLYYNHLRTGNPLLSPVQLPEYAANNGLGGNLLAGLEGLLFSPGKSVLVYCPITILSVLAIRRLFKTHRNEAIFVSVLAMLWLLLHAKLQSWYGAWGWGPRHWVTLTPVLALPFLAVRLSWRSRAAQTFAAVLLLFGFLLGATSIVINWHYRLQLAYQAGRLDDGLVVWSLWSNQVTDAFLAAAQNIHRTISGGAIELVHGASANNVATSNSINIWFFTAHRQGIPAFFLVLIALALITTSVVCLRMLWREKSTPARPAASMAVAGE